MPFVSVTRLRLRSYRYLPQFLWFAISSGIQVKRSPGNLNAAFLRGSRLTFWTLTIWKDEASMRAFMMSGAHRKAMPKLLDWCDEAALGHWTQNAAALPGWKEAHRRIVTEGRLSKVRYPSPDQRANRIPEPDAT
jgi:hypothetical protein